MNAHSYRKVDPKAEAIASALDGAPVYRKSATVEARPARPGERISTRLASGIVETENAAKEGDWIVKNPSGEEYILAAAEFSKRYVPAAAPGTYAATGCCRAIRNPFGEPIEIVASWGELQKGGEDCMVADVCDSGGGSRAGKPYLIDGRAFSETYGKLL